MAKKVESDSSKYSKFWFDDDNFVSSSYGYDSILDLDSKDDGKELDSERSASDIVRLMKLSAFMRSCGNFVQILTGKAIPVKYADGDNSYTDGKTVTLSSKVEDNFDSTVGLALHEASHIVKTDFAVLTKLFEDYKYRSKWITSDMTDRALRINPELAKWNWKSVFNYRNLPTFAPNTLESTKSAQIYLALQFKDILNWIEDRRIDNYVYSSAPGYRGYYEALYNRYFFADEVTKTLEKDKMYNDETLDSYIFRIINLMNPENNLDALKGLREIKSLINLPKISRLNTTEEVCEVSKNVLEIILKNIKSFDFLKETAKQNGMGSGNGNGQGDDMNVPFDIDSLSDAECKDLFGVSKRQLKSLLKKMEAQKQFVNGEMKKKKLSKKDASQMESIANSGATMESVGGEEFRGQKVNVVLLHKINDAIMQNETFASNFNREGWYNNNYTDAVSKGFVLGKMLGKRLQIRNEERTLKYTRLDNGKIDRRLVAQLGYEVENIFSKVETNKFNKAHIHISVDASGSMSGERFANALTMTTAIAVACRMTNNLDCVVSFRTTTSRSNLPLVYVGYDSRKDGLSHIRKYFPKFYAGGTTPESLCFEAMMHKVFPKMQGNENFYFVNLSDGEPCYSHSGFSYGGEQAEKHCRRMIDTMVRENGATIISYLIKDYDEDGYGYDYLTEFRKMYGVNNAFKVKTDSVEQIARTLNKKFLEGGGRKESNDSF